LSLKALFPAAMTSIPESFRRVPRSRMSPARFGGSSSARGGSKGGGGDEVERVLYADGDRLLAAAGGLEPELQGRGERRLVETPAAVR